MGAHLHRGGHRRLADDYLATLRAFGPEATRVTDKLLEQFHAAGRHPPHVPQRDHHPLPAHPIDTALSIFTTNFETNFDFASDRSDLVFFSRQYQRLMAHWREVLPPDRFVEMDYEALVADPEPHARRLVAACGLEWNDACLAPHLNTRKIDHGEHLAGASADLPHIGRTVAALRALARRTARVGARGLERPAVLGGRRVRACSVWR